MESALVPTNIQLCRMIARYNTLPADYPTRTSVTDIKRGSPKKEVTIAMKFANSVFANMSAIEITISCKLRSCEHRAYILSLYHEAASEYQASQAQSRNRSHHNLRVNTSKEI